MYTLDIHFNYEKVTDTWINLTLLLWNSTVIQQKPVGTLSSEMILEIKKA